MQEEESIYENLREILRQQWDHARHMEMERAYMLMAYGALLTVFFGLSTGENPVINVAVEWIIYFLLLVTLFCFFQTTRWTYAFECHREKAGAIAEFLFRMTGFNTRLDLSFSIPAMGGEVFRTRYLYPGAYVVFIIILCSLLLIGDDIKNGQETASTIEQISVTTTEQKTMTGTKQEEFSTIDEKSSTTIQSKPLAETDSNSFTIINKVIAGVVLLLTLSGVIIWFRALKNVKEAVRNRTDYHDIPPDIDIWDPKEKFKVDKSGANSN